MLAFGAISGVAMVAAGTPHYMAMAMSVLVYAGASQLAALQLVTSGTPLAIAILAELVQRARSGTASPGSQPRSNAYAILRMAHCPRP